MKRKWITKNAVLIAAMFALPGLAEESNDWPSFRGQGARGVADGHHLPSEWNAEGGQESYENIMWDIDIPGLGHSSPTIHGQDLFVLTAVAENDNANLEVAAGGKPTAADDNGMQAWILFCIDKKTGQTRWQQTVHRGKPRATRHTKATHANTSVCVDPNNVLVFLGSEGLHCYDRSGQRKWSRDLGVINISKYGIGWGFASSPIIFNDRIAITCDDPDRAFVAVLSLVDGRDVWRVSREEVCERSWSTPMVFDRGKSSQLIINGWPWIVSYDFETGKEIWRVDGGGDNPVPTPFESNGLVYITNAHGSKAPIYAIDSTSIEKLKPGKAARVLNTDSAELKWSVQKGGAYMSTPVVYRDRLFLGSSSGIIRCYNAKTGDRLYEKRLGKRAGLIASLVAGDEKVFCAAENGSVYVLRPRDEFELIAENSLGEPCLATPAISEGVIYFRTTKRLIAVK